MYYFHKKNPSSEAHTKKVWIYDLRTNKKFTLIQRPLTIRHLQEFMQLYKLDDIDSRIPTWSEDNRGPLEAYTYDEILARGKANLDIKWLKDENLIDFENIPSPELIINEIVEDVEEVLLILKDLKSILSD